MNDETKDKHAFGSWTLGGLEYAKLTMAAPELLAALVLCVEDYEDNGGLLKDGTPSHIMAARAAIDKARNGA